jgi:hypothetical protein
MWIETESYIGPCRRQGRERKMRLFDRRRFDGSDRDPSLSALLRQLRSHAQNLRDETQRRRFKLRLAATIGVARRAQANVVAAQLEKLDAAVSEAALAEPRSVAIIEHILDACSAALPA